MMNYCLGQTQHSGEAPYVVPVSTMLTLLSPFPHLISTTSSTHLSLFCMAVDSPLYLFKRKLLSEAQDCKPRDESMFLCVMVMYLSFPASLPSQEYTFLQTSDLGSPLALTELGGVSPEDRSSQNSVPSAQSRTPVAWHLNTEATCDMTLCLCAHRDSCQRGWRLLYIVAAYHSCSEVLQPHLTRFLHDVSRTPGLPFQGKGLSVETMAESLVWG